MNNTLELLFDIQTKGQEKLDLLSKQVTGIQTSVQGASSTLQGLDSAIERLIGALNELSSTISSLDSKITTHSVNVGKLGSAHAKAVTDVQAASAAIRGLEGNLSVRAVEQFTTKVLGMGAAFQMVFPAVGALAMAEIIGRGVEKVKELYDEWSGVGGAEKEALSVMQEMDKQFTKLIEKQKQFRLDQYERDHGRDARLLLEAQEGQAKAAGPDQQAIQRLERQIEILKRVAASNSVEGQVARLNLTGATGASTAVPRSSGLSPEEEMLARLAGLGESGDRAGQAAKLLPGMEAALRNARVQQENTRLGADKQAAEAADDKRAEMDREAEKRQRELQQAQDQAHNLLVNAQLSELSGIEKINAEYQRQLELLGKTPKAIEDINKAWDIAVVRELGNEIQKNAEKLQQLNNWWTEHGEKDPLSGGWRMKTKDPSRLFLTGYSEYQEKEDQKDVRNLGGALDLYDKADRDQVIREASKAARIAQLTAAPGGEEHAIEVSYQKRLDLAKQLEDIELRKAARITDTEEKEKALTQARYDYEKQIDEARMDRELKLLELRKKALDDYREQAGKVFDAITQRGGDGLQQFFRAQLTTLERQIFINASGGMFQAAGRTLGGVIPGQRNSDGTPTILGNLLAGTIFDPKNKSADPVASETAKQTKRTADEVQKLRMVFTGGTDTSDFNPNLTVADLPDKAFGAIPGLSIFGSDVNGITGAGSTIARSLGGTASSSSTSWLSKIPGIGSLFGGDRSIPVLTGGSTTLSSVLPNFLGGAGELAAGLTSGGTKGAMLDAGGAASIVGGILPMISTSLSAAGPIGSAVGMALSIIGGLFGSSREQRSANLTKELNLAHYTAPMSITATSDTHGLFTDYNYKGQVRNSNLLPYSSVDEPFVDRWNGGFINVPGMTKGQYGAPVTVNVQAWDTDSFKKYGPDIAKGLHQAMVGGQADLLVDTLSQRINPK